MWAALDKVSVFVAAVVSCSLLGMWADKKFGLAPYLTVSGVVVGTIVGFWLFLMRLKNKKSNS